MPSLAIAATCHDPSGQLAGKVAESVATLRRLAGVVHVMCTDATAPIVVAMLEAAGVIVRLVPVDPHSIGRTRREVLAWTADTHPNSWVLHSDLDHLLDCVARDDLAFLGAAESQADGCVVIGRAEEHVGKGPRELVLTEGICNELARAHFGIPTADFMFGMQFLGPESAAHVARKSICVSQATDIEWPLLVRAAGFPVSSRALARTWFEDEDDPPIGPAGQAARWHRRLRIAADVAELLSGEAGACQ